MELSVIQKITVWILPVIFAITVHEVAHGWIAMRLGDPTAKMLGRLTLNPVKHIDPIGTLLVPGVLLVLGGIMFGWAKPVPVTWENLKNPRRDVALVAIAGPTANLIMAFLWAIVAKIGSMLATNPDSPYVYLQYVGEAGIFINLILMILNLLPILPLDGGRVLAALLPGPISYKFSRLEPYGLIILLVLLFMGVLSSLLYPILTLMHDMMYALVGLGG